MRSYRYRGLEITWLGHDSFLIKGSRVIYTDPYKLRVSEPKADIITVSHDHFDHLSQRDILRVSKSDTVIVASANCRGKVGLGLETIFLKPGDTAEVKGVKVRAVPAYNINKFRAPGVVFHPREYGGVGFIVEIDGVRLFHAGDTDYIPEHKELEEANIDVAFLPVSGTYVMTAEEAAEAARAIKPKVAIPMHYGAIVGSRRDAEKFKQLLTGYCEVWIPG